MINICLCDDNHLILERYKTFLNKIAKKHTLDLFIREFISGEAILEYFNIYQENTTDIIFMDILMDRLSGIETARLLRENGYSGQIIYLTSNKEFAAEAYDTFPFYYLMKNEYAKKFEDVFLDALSQKKERAQEGLLCKKGTILKKIQLEDIEFMENYGRNIIIHLQKEIFEFNANMELIEDKIIGKGFVRSSRSYLVNLKYVRNVLKNKIEMYSGETVPLSSKNALDVKKEILHFNLAKWM